MKVARRGTADRQRVNFALTFGRMVQKLGSADEVALAVQCTMVHVGEVPSIKINTSPTNYHPIRQLKLARFDGKHWVGFGGVIGD